MAIGWSTLSYIWSRIRRHDKRFLRWSFDPTCPKLLSRWNQLHFNQLDWETGSKRVIRDWFSEIMGSIQPGLIPARSTRLFLRVLALVDREDLWAERFKRATIEKLEPVVPIRVDNFARLVTDRKLGFGLVDYFYQPYTRYCHISASATSIYRSLLLLRCCPCPRSSSRTRLACGIPRRPRYLYRRGRTVSVSLSLSPSLSLCYSCIQHYFFFFYITTL